MKYPRVFEELVIQFKKFPGVGNKSAERMAYQVLEFSLEDIEKFAHTLHASHKELKKCSICGHISEKDYCEICLDASRNKEVICVVQNVKDVFALEKAEEYRGQYHVLGGVISAVNGIGPEDLNLFSLVSRVKNEKIKEVIVATNPNIEGETTALYIASLLKGLPAVVTRIAYGLPVGGNLDYTDSFTLSKAFEGRRKI